MRQPVTEMYSARPKAATCAIEAGENLSKTSITAESPSFIDNFYLEAGINLLELPGTVGVIMPALEAWLQ